MKKLVKIFVFITMPIWFIPIGVYKALSIIIEDISESIDKWFEKE